jgi:Mobilization protein NikA
VALHATTIRFADRAYTAIARAADAQGISVSQYVREAALIRAVLDELDYSAEEAIHTAHDLLAVAREVRRLAQVDPPGPPRANPETRGSATRRATSR